MCLLKTLKLQFYLSLCLGLVSFSDQINENELCANQHYLDETNHIQTLKQICKLINFEETDKLHANLGLISLSVFVDDNAKNLLLNVSFEDILWQKSYLKLEQNGGLRECKIYSVSSAIINSPRITKAFDSCLNLEIFNNNNNSYVYSLEFKAELNSKFFYKKFLFNMPNLNNFQDSTPLAKREIFATIDAANNNEIILNIQPLSLVVYNVTFYKVEIYKENNLLDIRIINADKNNKLKFEYITYNEEGYYYFKISVISNLCPEDICFKSKTPKIFIKRKYPQLVIGIVGASFLIPFVLFLLHMWTRRSQISIDKIDEEKVKLYLVYNQTPEKHCLTVKAFEKALKVLINAQIVAKIHEASHIIYICGIHIFEPDPMVHKYLVIESNKAISNVDILIIRFPYSTKEIPPHLRKYAKFELMRDFSKFIHLFNCEAEFVNNPQYLDLCQNVNRSEIYAESKKIILNMPIIIVTEQRDNDESLLNLKENDVLL